MHENPLNIGNQLPVCQGSDVILFVSVLNILLYCLKEGTMIPKGNIIVMYELW